MGCLSCLGGLPPEVEEILKEVALKADEITDTFVIKANEIQEKMDELLAEREEEVSKADKNDKEKLEELLLDYNLKENEIIKEFIANEVDKMHTIYEMGLKLSEKLKKITLDQLEKKLSEAPAMSRALIQSQIDEVKNYSSKDFLDSKYGKPLKTALEKHGMKKEYIERYNQGLATGKKERRANERKRHQIEKNEFPPVDDLELNIDDLYEAIFNEYKGEFISSIKEKFLNAALKSK